MTSSGTSTDAGRTTADSGFRPLHFYVLLSMGAATVAVIVSDNTHPAALVLLSAAVIAAGLAGYAVHVSLAGFLGTRREAAPLAERTRETLEREKDLVLRSLKELEFDRSMGKVGEEDYRRIEAQLRTRALALMQDLDAPARPAPPPADERADPAPGASGCGACGTVNDPDARFCKECGEKLA